MNAAFDTDVLIAGAGPVGLTAALELSRHGVACRVVDPLTDPPRYAKAVGVQPQTLEMFEGMGILADVLDQSIPMRGQVVSVNGARVHCGAGVRAGAGALSDRRRRETAGDIAPTAGAGTVAAHLRTTFA